jgi:hypothetical protein
MEVANMAIKAVEKLERKSINKKDFKRMRSPNGRRRAPRFNLKNGQRGWVIRTEYGLEMANGNVSNRVKAKNQEFAMRMRRGFYGRIVNTYPNGDNPIGLVTPIITPLKNGEIVDVEVFWAPKIQRKPYCKKCRRAMFQDRQVKGLWFCPSKGHPDFWNKKAIARAKSVHDSPKDFEFTKQGRMMAENLLKEHGGKFETKVRVIRDDKEDPTALVYLYLPTWTDDELEEALMKAVKEQKFLKRKTQSKLDDAIKNGYASEKNGLVKYHGKYEPKRFNNGPMKIQS